MASNEVTSETPAPISTDTPMSRDSEVESPSSLGDETTPDSELSLSSEPSPDPGRHSKTSPFIAAPVDAKAKAVAKAKTLTFEEQVSQVDVVLGRIRCSLCPGFFTPSCRCMEDPSHSSQGDCGYQDF